MQTLFLLYVRFNIAEIGNTVLQILYSNDKYYKLFPWNVIILENYILLEGVRSE